MVDSELSRAVVAFTQRGRAVFPAADEDAVRAVATATPPDELVVKVEAVVDECLNVEIDWRTTTLGDGGRQAAAETLRRHPELDAAAADALAWTFTYTWR